MAVRADISITVGGEAIGLLRSAALDVELAAIGVAAEEEYGWDEFQPANRDWSATGSIFIPLRGTDDALVELKKAVVQRSTISVVVDYQDGGVIETGTAVVASIDMQAAIGGVLEGSIQLSGTGVLTAS